jgi:outer membrane protein assembly factor BamB
VRRNLTGAALLTAGALAASGAVLAGPATAAPAPFPDTIALPDGFQPEGIESDGGTTLFVGSLADGAIWAGDARTGAGSLLVEGTPGGIAVGLEYDKADDLLWVAGAFTGQVRAYDATTGDLEVTVTAPGPTNFLNDVVVTREAVYVTDSFIPQLLVIPTDGSDPTLLPITGDLQPTGSFDANGIEEVQGTLFVIQSSTGQLFQVDPDTGVSTQVDLGGVSLVNGDGIYARGRTLYVVQNQDDTIAEVRLTGRLDQGTVVRYLTDSDLDVPTTATIAAGRLYAVNARFNTPVTPDTSYDIVLVPRQGR